ncbi:hypothetical protein MSAN_00918700 [Mycena sanguinolenta]|uniref:Uncharacterized protein n=1 Tax=Mycena sanguinolenta TaxID=230812 RepID=A0A8H7D8X2_9AGAR|nr:hypothetical protein MSAN_00918700 [Mycena sanguinolenta]
MNDWHVEVMSVPATRWPLPRGQLWVEMNTWMRDSERTYVDLIFRASKKYASWDPEIPVKVGDYGRITQGRRQLLFFWRTQRNGMFLKEGNIFENGKAEEYKIPEPVEHGHEASEGETWVVSQNAEQVDVSVAVGGVTPALAQCNIRSAFKFSSGRGAILVMENDTIATVDPPGALRRLLEDPGMNGLVVVSEVHSCSSYARLLTAQGGNTVALGLSVEPPISGVASASANGKWVRNVSTGNFRTQVNKEGHRKFYPLFRLVSLTEKATSTGLRGSEEADDPPPLPDAEPPWLAEQEKNGQKAHSSN